MEETKSLSALNCIRNNRKTSREEIHELYGAEGVFVYDLFLARYSDARKQKDNRSIKERREEVLDHMEDELRNGKIKNPVKDLKRQELYSKIFIILCAIVSVICMFVFGGIVLMLIPPIWIIIILLLWVIKKMK